MVNEEFSIKRASKEWLRAGRNEIYCGTFEGIPDFCPAYVSREDWKKIQDRKNTIKKSQAWNVYLFSGLIRCPCCGHTLKATYKTYPKDRSIKYNAYRCNNGRDRVGECTYRSSISEKRTEKYLLAHMREMIKDCIVQAEIDAAQPQKKRIVKFDIEKAKEQLRRLNIAYFAGNMTDDEYTAMAKKLKEDIAKAMEAPAEEKAPDLEALKAFLDADSETIYKTLGKEDKRCLWRSIIQ